MDYRIIYLGSQIIYGLMFLTLFTLQRLGPRRHSPSKMDLLYVLFLTTIVLDSIWIFIEGVPKFRTWSILLELVYLPVMAFTGYVWFLYTLDLFPAKSMKIRDYRFLLGIPVAIEIVAIFLSVKTGWIFEVNADGVYVRGPYFIYTILLNYLYLMLGSAVALRCSREALLTIDRRRFMIAAFFPLPILFLTVIQILLPPGLPAMQGGVLISFTMLYGSSQNMMITRDPLTELPNRVAFEQVLMNSVRKSRDNPDSHLCLMEGDLDHFKSINDTLGHPAGDKALKIASDALKQIFHPYSAVVFRTGGDEFMIIHESEKPLELGEIRNDLNQKLLEIGKPEGFNLSMSIGSVEYNGKDDIRTYIEEVDRKLYEAKKDLNR